jgi:hypothetical protein
MNSHELAHLLLSKPDVKLVLQVDSEGNGYNPLRGVDFDIIYIEERCDSSVYASDWTAEDCDLDEEEWEELKKRGGNTHAVLFP